MRFSPLLLIITCICLWLFYVWYHHHPIAIQYVDTTQGLQHHTRTFHHQRMVQQQQQQQQQQGQGQEQIVTEPTTTTTVPPLLSCDLFILILTRASQPAYRQAIRDTWGRDLPLSFVIRFFVGWNETNVINEPDVVVLTDYIDDYKTLTLKRIHAMKWILERYQPRFVMKADDDVYINIPLLQSKLSSYPSELFLTGQLMTNSPVLHDDSRNAEPTIDMPAYPPYVSGAGYIMTVDVARYLAYPILPPKPLINEDAAIGMALVFYNVSIVHDNSVWPWTLEPYSCLPSATTMLLLCDHPIVMMRTYINVTTHQPQLCGTVEEDVIGASHSEPPTVASFHVAAQDPNPSQPVHSHPHRKLSIRTSVLYHRDKNGILRRRTSRQ